MENRKGLFYAPNPLIDDKEAERLEELKKRYEKLVTPSKAVEFLNTAKKYIPESIDKAIHEIANTVDQNKVYQEAMKIVANGFQVVEKTASKVTISSNAIIKTLNKNEKEYLIESLDEICFLRSYNISQAMNQEKILNLAVALAEGGGTGFAGFAGIPFNLVLSTFIYYRAVQTVAMFYGYDVKTDATELYIASEVLMNALSPAQDNASEVGSLIGKVMIFAESTSLKQAAKKSWAEMIAHGGAGLFMAQLRALANKSAQKALEQAGKKGLEESLFKSIFEQIGKRLSLKVAQRAIPALSAGIGALFDTAMMNQVLEFAEIFYQKRFIIEKENRIENLINSRSQSDDSNVVDADFEEIIDDDIDEDE